MSAATDLAGTDFAASHLSLAPAADGGPASPFPITDLDRSAIELYLSDVVTAQTLVSTIGGPVWGPIGEEVFTRTYARDTDVDANGNPVVFDADGQPVTVPAKEIWAETVRRVVLGNLSYAPDVTHLVDEDVELFWAVYNHRLVPAGRHLWVTGTKVSKLSRNCWVSGWSRRLGDHFRFLAARLFEGGGVGANYSSDLIASTPPVTGTIAVRFTCRPDHKDIAAIVEAAGDRFVEYGSPEATQSGWTHIQVGDSREGWTSAWTDLIDSATVADDHRFIYDVSDIRHYGAILKTFGGTASGPGPLVQAIVSISETLAAAAVTERRITGLEAMDIDHALAAAIVAGGARRSARLAAMHWADPEIFDFITCKTDGGGHWSANISVEVDDAFAEAVAVNDPHAVAVLDAVAAGMALNGEPGIIDTEFMSADEPVRIRITNPCGEATLSTDGDASGESCNLGSVNLDAFGTDHQGAAHAFRLLARFLYRSTLNTHPDKAAGRIEAVNRRLGAGFMGLQGWAAAHNTRLTELAASEELRGHLVDFRSAVREAADELADAAGLPRPVKVTAVAPTGSIAQMPGCTPGMLPVFARRFIRRVRFAETDPQWRQLQAQGHNVVPEVDGADSTMVVEFLVSDSLIDRFDENLIEQSDEVSFDQFNDLVAAVQESFCGTGDGQAVSATASIPVDSDPVAIARSIRRSLGKVKGMTAFPDASRELAPYERLSAEQFDALVAGGVPVATGGDSNDGACVGGACPVR